mgnify:CR=1 FL=1
MESKNINVDDLYLIIKKMQDELLHIKKRLNENGIIQKKELVLADESLLSEDWMSEEDKEAWKDL